MRNTLMVIVVGIIALLVVVGVGGGTAYLVFKYQAAETAAARPESDLAPGAGLSLKPFTTNLGDVDRPRYISVSFELVAKDEKDRTKLEQNTPLIRDTIVGILNAKKSLEVTGESGANKLKTDITEKLNTLLGAKLVQRVLITDFVVQF